MPSAAGVLASISATTAPCVTERGAGVVDAHATKTRAKTARLLAVLRTVPCYDTPMDLRCRRIRLKPGSLPRVREWAAEVTRRRDEVMATLRDETVRVETAFLERAPEGDFLIYYLRADDIEQCNEAARTSTHPIDRYHREAMEAVTESSHVLELLVDFDRSRE